MTRPAADPAPRAPRAPKKAEPVPTPETAAYWEGAAAGELRVQRCPDGHSVFPPRALCPECGAEDLRWVAASGRGTLHSYLVQHRPAPGWEDEVPYVVAIVQLEEGPRMMSNVVGVDPDPAQLPLDLPLVVDFVQRGEHALPVFRPAPTTAASA